LEQRGVSDLAGADGASVLAFLASLLTADTPRSL